MSSTNICDDIYRHMAHCLAKIDAELIREDARGRYIRSKLALIRRSFDGRSTSYFDNFDLILEGWNEDALGDPAKDARILNAMSSALGLLAIHQRRYSDPVDKRAERGKNRYSFGYACGCAVERSKNDIKNGIERRLRQVESAPDYDSAARHIRSLIQIIAGMETAISFDYAQFAVDLFLLNAPSQKHRVLLSWALDYSRFSAASQHDAADPDNN